MNKTKKSCVLASTISTFLLIETVPVLVTVTVVDHTHFASLRRSRA